MTEFRPTDPAFEVMQSVGKSVGKLSDKRKQQVMQNFAESLAAYPVQCPGQGVLARLFLESTPESFIHFLAVQDLAHNPAYKELGLDGLSPKVLRLLKDHNNNPVFWRVCDEVKKEWAELPDPPAMPEEYKQAASDYVRQDFMETMHRRNALKTIAGVSTMALLGDALLTPWTKEEQASQGQQEGQEKEGQETQRSIRYWKLARLGTEAAVRSVAKYGMILNNAKMATAHLIDSLKPIIEKETGIADVSPVLFDREQGASR